MEKFFKLNLEHFPKELRLILEIMKIENKKNFIRKGMYSDINWEKFIELAFYHRVYPLIYSKVKKVHIDWIPNEVCQSLFKEYQRNTFQMLNLTGEMEQVSKLFSENNIKLLFIKGPAIAADLYGDISLRTSKDLDILIQLTDLERADALLLDWGYQREVDTIENFDEKMTKHDVQYYHPKKRIQLEIHWRLHPYPMNVPSFNDLWDRRRKSNLTSYPVFYFGVEDLFLYLVTHGSKHGWFRLRWLADIDQFVRYRMNSENNVTFLKKYAKDHLGRRSDHFGGQALILANQLLDTPIDNVVNTFNIKGYSRRLAQMSITYINEKFLDDSMFEDNKIKSSNNKFILLISNLAHSFLINRYEFSIKTNSSKVLSILRVFSTPSIDREVLVLPKFLHFLYFPLRPLLWAMRKIRKSV